VKTLSIQQPWAALIAAGVKTIEVRTWRTEYRGPLLIHATKRSSFRRSPDVDPTDYADPELLGANGVVVAEGRLVDCRVAQPQDAKSALWTPPPGSFAWMLEDVRRLTTFVPLRGRLGLFDVDLPTGSIETDSASVDSPPPRSRGLMG